MSYQASAALLRQNRDETFNAKKAQTIAKLVGLVHMVRTDTLELHADAFPPEEYHLATSVSISDMPSRRSSTLVRSFGIEGMQIRITEMRVVLEDLCIWGRIRESDMREGWIQLVDFETMRFCVLERDWIASVVWQALHHRQHCVGSIYSPHRCAVCLVHTPLSFNTCQHRLMCKECSRRLVLQTQSQEASIEVPCFLCPRPGLARYDRVVADMMERYAWRYALPTKGMEHCFTPTLGKLAVTLLQSNMGTARRPSWWRLSDNHQG
eukprot:gnl/TRDRNA2_/TRDRNA2_110419_c0_seq1.p1 gnl/TRDRNA2_/TRDRNA2_110419_c0~~gnl/TRDRNA2_/TRDRNA2_110419_c0_seq1.p1  ORF type:complete len:266 (+),score=21.36 gnl/TRDRNA2_/TRDRNA2_110419_c0_seq1:407-1204(+)